MVSYWQMSKGYTKEKPNNLLDEIDTLFDEIEQKLRSVEKSANLIYDSIDIDLSELERMESKYSGARIS